MALQNKRQDKDTDRLRIDLVRTKNAIGMTALSSYRVLAFSTVYVGLKDKKCYLEISFILLLDWVYLLKKEIDCLKEKSLIQPIKICIR